MEGISHCLTFTDDSIKLTQSSCSVWCVQSVFVDCAPLN